MLAAAEVVPWEYYRGTTIKIPRYIFPSGIQMLELSLTFPVITIEVVWLIIAIFIRRFRSI